MPDLKPTVILTNGTVDNMSRHDMLDWVNSTVHGQYKKIEELCSGVAYCQMMDLLFPNTIGAKKIKCNARLEHEYLHNLKLFQGAFTKLKFDKSVPIDRLMKGKFQDNFEFLQWFKKFFDTYSAGKENLKVPAALAAAKNASKPIRKPVTGAGSRKGSAGKVDTLTTPKNNKLFEDKRSISPASLSVLQETHEELSKRMSVIESERNMYHKKVVAIETIVNNSLKSEAYVEWCTRVLEILYAADDTE